jgi:hypothetical protein
MRERIDVYRRQDLSANRRINFFRFIDWFYNEAITEYICRELFT